MSEEKEQTSAFSPRPAQRDAARKRAQNHFAASEKRDNDVRKEIAREQAAAAAQTAKLRALRLAKEEADRLAAAEAPVAVKKRKTKKA